MLQLIKEAGCYNGITPRDDFPVTEVLNQVCPSTWRGACKTAVQLLFGQAGLVSEYVWWMGERDSRDRRCFQACEDGVWACVKILSNFNSSLVLQNLDQIER